MTSTSRRVGLVGLMAFVVIGASGRAETSAQQTPPRRFVIDSHQHWRATPGYIDTLVRT